jgi:hypothetical protein
MALISAYSPVMVARDIERPMTTNHLTTIRDYLHAVSRFGSKLAPYYGASMH